MSEEEEFVGDPFSGERLLSIEPLYGQRRWHLDKKTGLLSGARSFAGAPAWHDGVNKAECHRNPGTASIMRAYYGSKAGVQSVLRLGISPEDQDAGCPFGFDICGHGFYAYFGHARNEFFGPGSVSIPGVIRATGKIDVGTEGFRASEAEIVAVTMPKSVKVTPRPRTWVEWIDYLLGLCGLTALMSSIYLPIVDFSPLMLLSSALTWSTLILVPYLFDMPIRSVVTVRLDANKRRRQVRANYPSVQIFDSTREMYEAFPVADHP